MRARELMLSVCLAVFCAFTGAASAEEARPLDFIHALQQKEYYDVAVDYLNMLKALGQMPAEVTDVWDLEMSRSLQGAAKPEHAFNAREADELIAKAQKHLDKFLKEKPNHPEALEAGVAYGSFAVDRALTRMRDAKVLGDNDKPQARRLLDEARADLEQSRPRFQKAIEAFQKRLAELPAVPAATSKRPVKPDAAAKEALAERTRLDTALVNAQFQAALMEYYISKTYDDPKSAACKMALETAAKSFDAIVQSHRMDAQGRVSVIGLTAKMWQGKSREDLGEVEQAFDIYEEVLANEDPKNADRLLDPLFAQIRQSYFEIVKRKDARQYLREARDWLEVYAAKSRREKGYQAVALEVAKTLLADAEKAAGENKAKLVSDAMTLLGEIARVPGPYQQEAFQIRKKFGKAVVTDVSTAKNFEDAVNLGQAAAEAGQWKDAAAGFARALQMSDGVKDAARVADVRNALAQSRLKIALQLAQENKLQESLKALGEVVREHQDTPSGPLAAVTAAKVAFALYSAVRADQPVEKQKALTRLQSIVELTEKNWPGKPEADEARLVLASVSVSERRFDDALRVCENVNPKSDQYRSALYLAASIYWQRYQLGKRGVEKRSEEQIKADRANAFERATNSLAETRKSPGAKLDRTAIKASLLLAEIALEGGRPGEAAGYVEPLVAMAKSSKEDSETASLVWSAATQIYLAAGDAERATTAGLALAEIAEDEPRVNLVLANFARSLDLERRNADADLTKANTDKDTKAIDDAKVKLTLAQQRMDSVVKKLAARKQHTVRGQMAVADLCLASNLPKEAGELYQKLLETPELDAKAAARARAQLVGILRREGKYGEAYKQVKLLMKDNPRALEFQLELGRILQSWGQQDPTQYPEAAAQWLQIRNRLQPLRPSKRPPEYYEVVYNAAYCLSRQAKTAKTQGSDKRTEALKLLKSTIIMDEKLNGPDMVAKYKSLIAELESK